MRRLLLILALLTGPAFSQVPGTIGYQGSLEDVEGNPVSGFVNLTFRLFPGAAGGTKLWQETHTAVPVENGFFSVSLGSIVPFNLDFKSQYFAEIAVNADSPMFPRVKLESTPYSNRASSAPRVVLSDALGNVLGEPIGLPYSAGASISAATLLTDRGYFFSVNLYDGRMVRARYIYYSEQDCQGDAMAYLPPGSVSRIDWGDIALYVPRNSSAEPSPVFTQSYRHADNSIFPDDPDEDTDDDDDPTNPAEDKGSDGGGSRCKNQVANHKPETPMFKVFVNDDAVTGVTTSSWQMPLKLERVQGSAVQ